MEFSIQSSFRTQGLTPPNGNGKPGANLVDLDPSAIVEQFAKMLVAQISNQDPDNAMDPTQIVSQYAQMTASLGMAKLTNVQSFYEQVRFAASTVGKVVSYDDPLAPEGYGTGTVTAADFSGPFPELSIDGGVPIPVTKVVAVWN